MKYLPRDFIETEEGLIFAVVDGQPEDGKVLSFLRYVSEGKVSTDRANAELRERHPHYLHHSTRLDAKLHAVPIVKVKRHHRPRQRVRELLESGPADAVEEKCVRLLRLLMDGGLPVESMGVTGSLLIGRHTPASDLDLVIYGRENFFKARSRVRLLIISGELQDLDEDAWRDAFDRRGCELGYGEFLWHELRKGNKGLIDRTKFDLALIVDDEEPPPHRGWRKTGAAVIRAKVLDAAYAFDQPARYPVDHPEIGEVLSFTHTYTGQALAGETIEASGAVETSADGHRRLIVGSSREALGEYILVIR